MKSNKEMTPREFSYIQSLRIARVKVADICNILDDAIGVSTPREENALDECYTLANNLYIAIGKAQGAIEWDS